MVGRGVLIIRLKYKIILYNGQHFTMWRSDDNKKICKLESQQI